MSLALIGCVMSHLKRSDRNTPYNCRVNGQDLTAVRLNNLLCKCYGHCEHTNSKQADSEACVLHIDWKIKGTL